MSQILGRASPCTSGCDTEMEMKDHLVPSAAPPRSWSCRIHSRFGAAATPPGSPSPRGLRPYPKRTGEAEGETESYTSRGRGWPAFSHVEAELATRGKRPQAPEACVRPRPGGMTVRFGYHGLDVPGARDP